MKVRTLGMLAAALGIWAGPSVQAQEPTLLKKTTPAATAKSTTSTADNQALAEKVATKLASGSIAYDADLKLYTTNGVVSVTGTCRSEVQKQEILNEIRVIEGVTLVRDGLKVAPIMQAQAAGGPRASAAPSAVPPGSGDPMVEPLPLGPAGGGADMQAPPLPGYAWPTYAPYNNLSRVAYPTAYPYNAFPFIGPYYPFPKVPLGWRKVTLEWEDGHWWLGRKQAPIDYWKTRFW